MSSAPSSVVFSTDARSDLADPDTWRSRPLAESPQCTVTSTERVLPLQRPHSAPTPTEWKLCPTDWLMGAAYTIRTVLFYEAQPANGSGPGSEQPLSVPRLRRALQSLLQSYPILCGRFVAQSDGTVTVRSSASDLGVPLVATSIDAPLSSLPLKAADYKTQRQIPAWPLVTEFDYANAVAQDVFTLTVSRFTCGGVALGVHMHHWLGDAEAIFAVLNDLAELYAQTAHGHAAADGRQLRLRVEPCLDRSCLQVDPDHAAELTRNFEPTVYEVAPDAKLLHEAKSSSAAEESPSGASADPSPAPAPAVRASLWRVWRFEASEIAAIKAAASASMSVEWVSTFEALTAHIVRCVMRARAAVTRAQPAHAGSTPTPSDAAHGADDLCRVNLFVNYRSRLRTPPLPAKLFANGVLMTQARVPMSVIVSDDQTAIGRAASALHTTLEGLTESSVRSTLAWVASQPDKSRIGLRHGPLIVTSWCKFNVYGVSFDGATPSRVTFPFAESAVDGIITLIDAPPSDPGAIDVYQGIHHDTAAMLERDQEWRKFR